jgi:hypothetical protein
LSRGTSQGTELVSLRGNQNPYIEEEEEEEEETTQCQKKKYKRINNDLQNIHIELKIE